MDLQSFVNTVAPPLARAEEIYLQSLTELARSQLGKHSLLLILIFSRIGKYRSRVHGFDALQASTFQWAQAKSSALLLG